MRRNIALASAITVLCGSAPALAQGAGDQPPASSSASADLSLGGSSSADPGATEPSDGSESGGAVLVGGKLGGIVPFGGLSPFVTVGIEAGYIFPWMNRSFAAALYVDYTAPKADGSKQDPRLGDAGGTYEWKLTEQELTFMPVVMYRLTSLGTVTPYAGIGPRIYLLKSTVQGSAMGAPIDETTEQSTKVGFGIPVGVEFELGPGALLAELLFQYGGLDHEITGDANTGALSLSVGYRGIL